MARQNAIIRSAFVELSSKEVSVRVDQRPLPMLETLLPVAVVLLVLSDKSALTMLLVLDPASGV